MTVLRRATLAVSVVFILAGFAFASWAARIPAVRDELSLSAAQIGVLLLIAFIGSLAALLLGLGAGVGIWALLNGINPLS